MVRGQHGLEADHSGQRSASLLQLAWSGLRYKVGHSEMLRQRELARARPGPRFDLRDFNQAVVDGGNAPLDVLAGNVKRYMTS
jgi:uncharacterized protein (DUF885 family)